MFCFLHHNSNGLFLRALCVLCVLWCESTMGGHREHRVEYSEDNGLARKNAVDDGCAIVEDAL
jgi:hypothetical protein